MEKTKFNFEFSDRLSFLEGCKIYKKKGVKSSIKAFATLFLIYDFKDILNLIFKIKIFAHTLFLL